MVLAVLTVVVGRLGRMATTTEAVGRQVQAIKAANEDRVESLAASMRAAERAATEAETTARGVSRQIRELNRVTVDQALILVEVRDHLASMLSAADDQAVVVQAERKG